MWATEPRMIGHYFKPSLWTDEMCSIRLDPWQREQIDSTAHWQIWNCSRQSGKSTTAALKALHTAIHRPGSLSLLLAPSERQSSELFEKVSQFYQQLPRNPPWHLVGDSTRHLRMVNDSRIVVLPGNPDTVRGYTAELVVLDEAAKCSTDLYRTIRPMLLVNDGTLILASTPFGKRGFFWDVWRDAKKHSEFERRLITADDCPRLDQTKLDIERVAQGDWFDQEYMGKFLSVEGGLFTEEQLEAMSVADSAGLEDIARPWVPVERMSATNR